MIHAHRHRQRSSGFALRGTGLASGAALLLAGCTLAPSYERPAAPIPPRFEEAGPATAPSVATLDWSRFFAPAELRTLIASALTNNRDLRIAAARIEQARAGLAARTGDLLPQAQAQGGMSKLGVPDDFEVLTGKNVLTGYDVLAQASWELDFFGRLRSLRAAAQEQLLASEEARRAIATGLIAQIAAAYLADRDYAERLELARATLANREQSLHMLTRRYQLGSGSKLEVTQAETLLTQARGQIEAIELQRAQNLNALSLLAGRPVTAAEFSGRLADTGLAQPLPTGLPSDLLVNRPDIVAAEHRLKAANADIGAARAAFFPSITLAGAGGTVSPDLDKLFAAGTGLWLFQPKISLPIFTGGKLHANLHLSQAQRDEAVADYEKTIQSAFRDVRDALAQRYWLAEQVATGEQALAALGERARLARLRYDAGRSAYLEVLDAERDRFSAEQNLVQLRGAWLASGVSLYAALGGGLPDRAPPASTEAKP